MWASSFHFYSFFVITPSKEHDWNGVTSREQNLSLKWCQGIQSLNQQFHWYHENDKDFRLWNHEFCPITCAKEAQQETGRYHDISNEQNDKKLT